eukprot:scaffold313_cov140-Skeletonema_dohrnii-CCMP3373.AAC.1
MANICNSCSNDATNDTIGKSIISRFFQRSYFSLYVDDKPSNFHSAKTARLTLDRAPLLGTHPNHGIGFHSPQYGVVSGSEAFAAIWWPITTSIRSIPEETEIGGFKNF